MVAAILIAALLGQAGEIEDASDPDLLRQRRARCQREDQCGTNRDHAMPPLGINKRTGTASSSS